uniref:Ubiquitin-like protease family profile domain-containing protein n=1 Tax=Oryza barthii TaxID=65489 RepID=A0A0D3H1S9_9ORYZ
MNKHRRRRRRRWWRRRRRPTRWGTERVWVCGSAERAQHARLARPSYQEEGHQMRPIPRQPFFPRKKKGKEKKKTIVFKLRVPAQRGSGTKPRELDSSTITVSSTLEESAYPARTRHLVSGGYYSAEDNLLTLLLLEEVRKYLSVDNGQAQKENTSSHTEVTLYLDGTEHEFVENFIHCQGHYRFWLLWNSAFRILAVMRRRIFHCLESHSPRHAVQCTGEDQEKYYDELVTYLEEELGLKMHKARRFDLDCTNHLVKHHPMLPDRNLSAQAQIDSDTINEAPQALPTNISSQIVSCSVDEAPQALPTSSSPISNNTEGLSLQALPTSSESAAGVTIDDLHSFCSQEFITDPVNRLSDRIDSEYVLLVNPAMPHLLGNSSDATDLDCTNQLVENHPKLPDQNLSAQAQIDGDTINEAPQALPTSVGSQIGGCSVDETLQALPLAALPTSSESAAGVTIDDLRSLCSQEFITDPVVVHAFNRLSDRIDSEDVLLVNPAMSHLLGNSDATVDPHLLGEGTHWSLLLFDRNLGGRPCLAHHDSSPGDANLRAAHRLAASLLPYLPPETKCTKAPTPKQNNGTECALYMIKCAEVICESHWLGVVARGVTMDSVDDLRAQLIHDIGQLLNGSSSS